MQKEGYILENSYVQEFMATFNGYGKKSKDWNPMERLRSAWCCHNPYENENI